MTLDGIERFVVPRDLIKVGETAIRRAGRRGDECFVLWSGVVDGPEFRVLASHVPRQTAFRFNSGVCVRVDGTELHRLGVWLFEARQQLGAQIHSHPRDAYHSETDDAFPIVNTLGGLSIVVPWFGLEQWFAPGTAAYRLQHASGWRELPDRDFRGLVEITL
jgi:hypothetical protein